jgi:hypothetical protein
MQVVEGGGSGFFGDERWAGEMAARGGFAVTFGAILLELGVRGQASISRLGLGGEGSGCEGQC